MRNVVFSYFISRFAFKYTKQIFLLAIGLLCSIPKLSAQYSYTPSQFSQHSPYCAYEENGLWGFKYYDCTYIYPQYEAASLTADNGYAAVKIKGKWGFVNSYNKLICPAIFDDINLSSDDIIYSLSTVIDKEREAESKMNLKKWGKLFFTMEDVNETKTTINISGQYCNLEDGYLYFKNNRKISEINRPMFIAAVKYEGKWGYIDALGKFIIEPQYEEACAFTYCYYSEKWDGMVANVKKDGKWGVIDLANNIIKPFNKKKPVKDKYYNSKLRSIKPTSFALKNAKLGVYKEIKERLADKLEEANNDTLINSGNYDVCILKEDSLFGAKDSEGKEIIPHIYEAIFEPEHNIVRVVKNGKYGLFNLDSQIEIVPCVYDEISPFESNGYSTVRLGTEIGEINIYGYCDLEMSLLKDLRGEDNTTKKYNKMIKLAKVNPYNLEVLCSLGAYYMNQEDYKNAISFYGKAKELIGDSYDFNIIQYRNKAHRGYANAWDFHDGYYVKSEASTSTGWDYLAQFINSSVALYSTISTIKNDNNVSNSGYGNNETFSPQESSSNRNNSSNDTNSDRNAKWMAANYQSQKAVYSNYESQLIKMNANMDSYNESQRKDIQAKMKNVRETIVSHGGTCPKSSWETWTP
ncbi:MAG: WG repeat-containing protein [Prevotella sp.]|nr:WG repeat-containing protein [Prevotella sp.]